VRHSETDWDFSGIDELTEIQLRAVELTMQGHSDAQIARMLNIERRTLWRWKTLDPDYRRVLGNARIQLYAAATDRYQILLSRATAIIARFLNDPQDQRSFPAAVAVLNMAGCFKPLPPRYFQEPSPAALPDPQDFPEPVLEPKVG
jgi:hypothetical protein